MMCCGRLFHARDAATGNDRSSTVVRRVRRTTSIDDDAERSLHRARESAGRISSSARYGGAGPCIHLNTSTASLKSIRSFGPRLRIRLRASLVMGRAWSGAHPVGRWAGGTWQTYLVLTAVITLCFSCQSFINSSTTRLILAGYRNPSQASTSQLPFIDYKSLSSMFANFFCNKLDKINSSIKYSILNI